VSSRSKGSRPDRRVAVLDRFPFTVPYQIKGDDIVVLAP